MLDRAPLFIVGILKLGEFLRGCRLNMLTHQHFEDRRAAGVGKPDAAWAFGYPESPPMKMNFLPLLS